MAHNAEPWVAETMLVRASVIPEMEGGDYTYILAEGRERVVVCRGLSEDNAERIVACINACRDIPTNMLEAVARGEARMGYLSP